MGNFEKLVVLIVLFLSAVVLAVSLRDDEVAAGSPLDAAQARLRDAEQLAPPASEPLASTALPEEEEVTIPGFLLDAEVPRVEERIEAPVDDGPVRILRTTHGLEPSALEDFMVYSVETGDTWSTVAERFYRDRRLAEVLGRANEGVRTLVEGTSILVPVYDLTQEADEREPWVAVAAPVRVSGRVEPVEAALPGDVREASSYVVVNGDTLSGISQKVYGSAQRWKAIFEANRDRMETPDWLQVGMRLSIPRGEELEGLRRGPEGRPRVR